MAQEMFHFIVYVNGAIMQGENVASFQSDAPLMFRNTRVHTLYELKQVILSHLASDGPCEIRRLANRFQEVTPDDRLEYRPSWLSEDRHVWITFEVHRRIMQDRLMEFLVEVRPVGGSSDFVRINCLGLLLQSILFRQIITQPKIPTMTMSHRAIARTRMRWSRILPLLVGRDLEVRKVGGGHTCLAPVMADDHSQLDNSLITTVVLPMVKTNPSVSVPLLQTVVQ
ncbi:hypothetical protein PIB30_006078 [Stylosanthes scabra]|uniref:Uncharacterized protein n=1 Tax=Stylosanthes scabra TaxID=79078 RepID=A0ABU6V6B6_9FABA|nr:hypothetical protein [Stylosanthes scabra]